MQKLPTSSSHPIRRWVAICAIGIGIALAAILTIAWFQPSSSPTLALKATPIASAPPASAPVPSSTADGQIAPNPGKATIPPSAPPVSIPTKSPLSPKEAADDQSQAKIPQPQAKPVGANVETAVVEGVNVSISAIESVQGEAQGVGEIAGPAVRFTVSLENATSAPVSTESLVVTVDYGTAQTPAIELSGPGAKPFQSTVAAHATATAIRVFAVPTNERGAVRISVNYQAKSTIAVFAVAAS